jgi:hypothetical protein
VITLRFRAPLPLDKKVRVYLNGFKIGWADLFLIVNILLYVCLGYKNIIKIRIFSLFDQLMVQFCIADNLFY